jgi:hypothetical protein
MYDRIPITQYISPLGFAYMTDITVNLRVADALMKEGQFPVDILAGDKDRPDIFSDKLYGDSRYHWLLLQMNEAVNPYYDWVLAPSSFDNYVDEKHPGYTLFLTNVAGDKPFEGSFRKNDIVYATTQTNPGLQPSYQNANFGARVHSFDPVMGRLVLEFAEKTLWIPAENSYIAGKNTDVLDNETYYVARVGKSIQSPFAMHHFEREGSILNPLLPLSLQESFVQPTDLTGFTFGQTLLGRYINEDFTDFVVTNLEHEVAENDDKRGVVALPRQYVEKVIKQVEESLSNG